MGMMDDDGVFLYGSFILGDSECMIMFVVMW